MRAKGFPMSALRPISWSDDQLSAVMRASQPLEPYERSAFLSALATLFQGRSEVGDGELFRSIKQLQREHFRPPALEHPPQQLARKVR
jgi:hypothetical protein